jgi:hypothetical protein
MGKNYTPTMSYQGGKAEEMSTATWNSYTCTVTSKFTAHELMERDVRGLLEPCDSKEACTVPRGEEDSDALPLPDR